MIRHARMLGQADAVAAGPRSRLDRRPGRARPDHRRRKARAAQSLGRERYLERMWQFINETREVMLGQQRRLGGVGRLGPPALHDGRGLGARPSATAFKRLYDDGLAYRDRGSSINWCPGCRTSVSRPRGHPDARDGHALAIRYHLVDEATASPTRTHTITVATTRPETILGDTAVAVHPDDERYRGARRPHRPDPVRRARRAGHRRRRRRARIRHGRA